MNGQQHLGPGRLLLRDASIVLLLMNDARGRILSRLTGLSGLSSEESWIITLLALAAVGKVFEDTAPPMPAPSAGDLLIGGSMLSEMAHRIAGPPSRTVPGFGALLAFALIWKYHPVARGSFTVARTSAKVMAASERRLRTFYRQLAESAGDGNSATI